MKDIELLKQIDFKKGDGLVPAIVQDVKSRKVLMMGYMSKESYRQSLESGKLCFYSRSKKRLWTKGEESGNFLYLKNIRLDCDRDTLLFSVEAVGPVCHTGSDTCWKEDNQVDQLAFLHQLEQVIAERKKNQSEKSYTASLFQKGINKIAQKVGEEAVELVIESKDENKDLFLGEAADLLFHYLVLLQAKGVELYDVLEVLEKRHGGEK